MEDVIVITDEMKREAFFTFSNGHARDNANYPIALEVYKQKGGNDVPFAWDLSQDIMDKAKEINNVLFQQYLDGSLQKHLKGRKK